MRNYNRRILNGNMLSMNNMNRYYRQPFYNQRDILSNNNLDDIEEEDEEEEENEEEIEQDINIEQDENIDNLPFNSENSSPSTTSLREEYSIYAPLGHHRRRRSRAPSYESYMSRIYHSNFSRIQSNNRSEISNSESHNNNNSDTKNNDTVYPENNLDSNNTISDIKPFENNNNSNITLNNNNNNNENIHHETTNDPLQINNDLKFNTPSYKNINMKLYEDLNILTPPATEDDINIKEEKNTENEKINTDNHQDININNSENQKSQSILIIPTVDLGSFDKNLYSNIPKEDHIDSIIFSRIFRISVIFFGYIGI